MNRIHSLQNIKIREYLAILKFTNIKRIILSKYMYMFEKCEEFFDLKI